MYRIVLKLRSERTIHTLINDVSKSIHDFISALYVVLLFTTFLFRCGHVHFRVCVVLF